MFSPSGGSSRDPSPPAGDPKLAGSGPRWPARPAEGAPDRRAKLRERVKLEHALAHVGHWQGRRARYRGTRKNLSDLRRAAVVHNLHVIARQTRASHYWLTA